MLKESFTDEQIKVAHLLDEHVLSALVDKYKASFMKSCDMLGRSKSPELKQNLHVFKAALEYRKNYI